MSLADDLVKLEELRRTGALTDREFDQAKAALLAGGRTAGPDPVAANLGAQLAEVRYQNELARIDREWEIEKEQYMVADKYGRRHVPTTGMGYSVAVFGGVFGVFWTVMAVSITGGAPDFGPFAVAGVLFPVVGVAITIGTVVFGVYCVRKAEAYNRALAAYQARRAAVRPEDFR
ncbi:MAG: hypothetical protein C0501_02750 [Isosphaera sp.]|nr:hypothetical protein [Isosphaera sp.]